MTVKEVNPHFEDYLFNWDQTFQFLVGGYGSSKSYHTALKVVLKLLQEKRTALVVREVFETHRDSTFSLFATIIDELGVQKAAEAVSSISVTTRRAFITGTGLTSPFLSGG